MNTVVLFGAGASTGSGSIDPYPTPLGKELFNKLKSNFPNTWRKLSPTYDISFNNNFEHGMDIIYKSSKTKFLVTSLMRDMAVYFCNFQPSDSNLYIKFLTELKNSIDNILFSTLNYDLLFETAGKKIRLEVEYFDNIGSKLNFLKLHGSSNFLPPRDLSVRNSKFAGGNAIKTGDMRIGSVEEVKEFCATEDSVSPMMSIYLRDKPMQFVTDKVINVQSRWDKEVLNADRILIIGVRPNPDDKHIWDNLSSTNAMIGYIGNEMSLTIGLINIGNIK